MRIHCYNNITLIFAKCLCLEAKEPKVQIILLIMGGNILKSFQIL